jgi:hypothetical protein
MSDEPEGDDGGGGKKQPPKSLLEQAREELTVYKRWEIARETIKREDDLTDHRLRWFLTLQGFLFAGFGVIFVALTAPKSISQKWYCFVALIVFCILGIVISVYVQTSVNAALTQLWRASFWWKNQGRRRNIDLETRAVVALLPDVRGMALMGIDPIDESDVETIDDVKCGYFRHFLWPRPSQIPNLLALAWVILTLLVIVTVVSVAPESPPQPAPVKHEVTIKFG